MLDWPLWTLMKRLIIAIDGPSGAGKGTVARALAGELGYRHIDTGAMYRAVAWKSQHDGLPPEAADAVAPRRFAGLRAFFGRRVDVAAWALNVIGVLFGVQLVIIAALVFSRPADQFAFQIDGVSAGTEVIVDGRSVGTSADPAVRLHLATSTQSVQVKVPPAPAGSGRATGAKSTAPRPVATSTLAPPPVQSANGVTTMTPAQPPALQQGFVSRAWHFSTDWIGALYRRVKYSLQN